MESYDAISRNQKPIIGERVPRPQYSKHNFALHSTEKALFKTENDNFIVKAVARSDEVKGLLEVGFEYVCEKDGLMFFRKRK